MLFLSLFFVKDKSDETKSYIKNLSKVINDVQDYLLKSIPEITKQDSNSVSGLGLNGLLNFIRFVNTDNDDNPPEILFRPKLRCTRFFSWLNSVGKFSIWLSSNESHSSFFMLESGAE